MAEANTLDFHQPSLILEEEDEATLAAIDRGIQAADAGRVVTLDEVRERMQKWLTKSSSLTKR